MEDVDQPCTAAGFIRTRRDSTTSTNSSARFDWKLTEPLRQNRRLRFNVEQFQCASLAAIEGLGEGVKTLKMWHGLKRE